MRRGDGSRVAGAGSGAPRAVVLADGTAVSLDLALPAGFRRGAATAVVLAHGAGTNMGNPLLVDVQRGLVDRGAAVARFNFAYTEAGRRAPDRMPALEECYRRVAEAVRAAVGPARLVLGGRSMGGRVASHLAAAGFACDGLIFLGYPLHPAGRPEALRTAHLPHIRVPMLFLTGTRDRLSDLSLLEQSVASLAAPATVHVVAGADHSFAVPRREARSTPVAAELVDVCARWLENL